MRHPILVAALLLTFATGCGAAGKTGTESPSTPAPDGVMPGPASPSGGGPTAPSGGSTGSPSPPVTRAPAFPRAKDGTDVRACKDGTCEILVTKRTRIPLAAHFGFATMSFDPGDRTWRFSYADGGSSSIAFLEPPYSGQWAAPRGDRGLNLTVVAFERRRAVIAISPTG